MSERRVVSVELPAEAVALLREGRMIDAIRLLRERDGIGLKEAKDRVDAAIAMDPSLAQPSAGATFVAYILDSGKLPLVAGFGAGAAALYLAAAHPPGWAKEHDPGVMILAAFGAPFAITAIWTMLWQRRRRAATARAAAAVPVQAAPARPKFSGLPDPGTPAASHGLPPAALAALDRDDPIEAIKILRSERGLGLAEAKALVDAERAERSR